MGIDVFKRHIREKRAIIVSTKKNKNNIEFISSLASCAQSAKASAISVIADKKIFDAATKFTKLPVFVSSIHPYEILHAVQWGARAIEIGDFSEIYQKNSSFSIGEIYDIILETMGLINNYDVYTSVCLSADLDIESQIKLIKKLEILGVDLIEVQGLEKIGQSYKDNIIHYIKSPKATIDNTYKLSKRTIIPIVSTSMDYENSLKAFTMGASAVKIDSALDKLETKNQLTMGISKIVGLINYRNSINKEIVKTPQELEII